MGFKEPPLHNLKKSRFFGLSDLCRYSSGGEGGGWGGRVSLDGLKRNKVRLSNRRLICTMRLPGARDKVVIVNLFTYF